MPYCRNIKYTKARTIATRISQELDALLEGEPEGRTSVTEVLKGMLLPHRLDLLFTVAIKLIEDIDEQIREYIQNLAWRRLTAVLHYLSFRITAKDSHCLPSLNIGQHGEATTVICERHKQQ